MYHELYGKYYQIIFKLLNSGPKTEKEINDYIRSNGFEESFLYLNADTLVDVYRLFEKRGDLYYPKTKNKLPKVLTSEQIAWIKTMLTDEKISLFMSKEKLKHYQSILTTQPLYNLTNYQYHFIDKDKDIVDEKISSVHQSVLKAIKANQDLYVSFISNKNFLTHKKVAPYKIEYSMQDQKLRILAVEYQRGKLKRLIRIRMASIIDYRILKREQTIDFRYYLEQELLSKPLVIEVYPELNGIERVFIELSNYKRESTFDEGRHCSIMKIYYEKADEMDLVLKMLSFGKVVKIISDGFIKDEVLRRLKLQQAYIKKRISI